MENYTTQTFIKCSNIREIPSSSFIEIHGQICKSKTISWNWFQNFARLTKTFTAITTNSVKLVFGDSRKVNPSSSFPFDILQLGLFSSTKFYRSPWETTQNIYLETSCPWGIVLKISKRPPISISMIKLFIQTWRN